MAAVAQMILTLPYRVPGLAALAWDLPLRCLRFLLFKNCFLLFERCLQRAGQALKPRVQGVGLILEQREATETFEQKVTEETKNSRTDNSSVGLDDLA